VTTRARLRTLAAASGIIGPALLVVYFAAPAVAGWPYAGASPDHLVTFARSHQLLFYAGGWLQATGSLLCIVFFLCILQLCGCWGRLAGSITLVGAAVLLGVVVIEAALLEAAPGAAQAGDMATVATSFALSNGVFVRIFPLAPAPLVFLGTGMMLRSSDLLPRPFAVSAFVIAGLFEVSGLAAVFSSLGVFLAIAMSIVQALWIVVTGVALAFARLPAESD
jgi:hypothetical protein